jgi:hypothetical protein
MRQLGDQEARARIGQEVESIPKASGRPVKNSFHARKK